MVKPSLARGMRDFTPEEITAREYIFDIIRKAFRQYGFQPLETPVIENLSTLTEKYGEEGDKLLFKVLDSGDYLEQINKKLDEIITNPEKNTASVGGMKQISPSKPKMPNDLPSEYNNFININSIKESIQNYLTPKQITPLITEKGLRYDLTVPLARYVAMYKNELVFPFKRYQIDKVWRADRPQKGRYREFYQCDGDIIGSYSFMYDAECVLLYDDVLTKLNLPDFIIKINNRKILSGLAEEWGFSDKFNSFIIAIDKWDKIGEDGVVRELANRGFVENQIFMIQNLFRLGGTNEEKITRIAEWMIKSETGKKGLAEITEVLGYLKEAQLKKGEVDFDITLARGLDYYTSSIFEVAFKDYPIGSIGGGGRYDELTTAFGVPDMPGVGISFGAERIYDVMKDLKLFPEERESPVKVLLANFGGEEEKYAFGILQLLRAEGIGAEMYPGGAKMGKQFTYADKKRIPNMLIIGSEEMKNNTFSIKNLKSGEQKVMEWKDLITELKK